MYKAQHNKDSVSQLGRQDNFAHQATINLQQMVPHQFAFETSKQRDYKGFKMQQRPQTAKPRAEAVRTHMPQGHYNTGYRQQFVEKSYRVPEVDLIPYP